MLFNMFYTKFCCLIIAACASFICAENTNITIPLNKIITYSDKTLYEDFIYINGSSTIQISFTDVQKTIYFIIFQVHSHLYDVTLYNNKDVRETVMGTNIGLYSSAKNGLDTFYIQNGNENELKLLMVVQGYLLGDPIPGGCNMVFPVPISPFLEVSVHNKTYIDIDAAPPQVDVNCLQVYSVITKFYMMYLPEHNFDADVYFDVIRNMTRIEFVRNGNAREMVETKWPLRRMVSAYPGTGAVYVAVAITADEQGNRIYSMYVPSHSYGCLPLVENDCELLADSLSMCICALTLFMGIFICYFGHRFFNTQIVVLGFLVGLVFNYILLSIFFDMDHPALLAASALSGLFIGLTVWVSWWLFGLPIVIIIAFCLQIGFLIGCIFYYIAPAQWVYTYISQDINFWSLFVLITLLVTICLISVSHIVNILCCTVVGGYATVYSLDYYIGSNMKYILNNLVRRATWPQFSKAILVPPFQFNDWILTFLWISLIITGFYYQFRQNKGKPPFPPPPRSVPAVPEEPVPIPRFSRPSLGFLFTRRVRVNTNERTPLLA